MVLSKMQFGAEDSQTVYILFSRSFDFCEVKPWGQQKWQKCWQDKLVPIMTSFMRDWREAALTVMRGGKAELGDGSTACRSVEGSALCFYSNCAPEPLQASFPTLLKDGMLLNSGGKMQLSYTERKRPSKHLPVTERLLWLVCFCW